MPKPRPKLPWTRPWRKKKVQRALNVNYRVRYALKNVYCVQVAYAKANDGRYPGSVEQLRKAGGDLADKELLSGRDYESRIVLVGGATIQGDPEQIVVYDTAADPEGWISYVTCRGEFGRINSIDALRQRLEQQRKAREAAK
jgi:hypothetical protein